MKILVIGGTGHIGSYLVPRLLRAGHEIQVISRTCRPRYGDSDSWKDVQWISADRKAEEEDDSWLRRMKALNPDVVVDLICFLPDQNRVMMEAFKGRIAHFLHCGTLWAYGPAKHRPYLESHPRRPITDYGRRKAEIEEALLAASRSSGFPATVIHPGHISGKEWLPIDPQGTIDGTGVYERLADGREVILPDAGQATLHHVHADDVAQIFEKAIAGREKAVGESFSAAAARALTLVECCEAASSFFQTSPNLRFLPLKKMKDILGEESFGNVETHVAHSPCASIDKACQRLGHEPGYSTEQIYAEVLTYQIETGRLKHEKDPPALP